jgi:hypothetical protein
VLTISHDYYAPKGGFSHNRGLNRIVNTLLLMVLLDFSQIAS